MFVLYMERITFVRLSCRSDRTAVLPEIGAIKKTVKFSYAKKEFLLTHFQLMFQLWINQVVGFYYRYV